MDTKNEIVEMPRNELAATSEQDNFLAMMERLAMSNVDVAKIEKMMDLQERMLNRRQKDEFAAAYVEMKPNLPKVLRTKHNTQTDSKYAPLEDINAAVDSVLQKYGFGTATKVLAQSPDSVTVKAELWHRGGHIEETTITMPIDNMGIKGTVNKTGPHATASSVTYAKRVAICALLNISTGDDKDGNQEIKFIDNEKAVEIDLLITTSGSDKAKFLQFMGVDDVRHIRANEVTKAIRALNKKKNDKAA